jgi:hypothetical protein
MSLFYEIAYNGACNHIIDLKCLTEKLFFNADKNLLCQCMQSFLQLSTFTPNFGSFKLEIPNVMERDKWVVRLSETLLDDRYQRRLGFLVPPFLGEILPATLSRFIIACFGTCAA